MKRCILKIMLCVVLALVFLGGCSLNNGQEVVAEKELSYSDIADEMIRFHVIANSDSEEDQNLKLKVRDRVIQYISDKLIDVSNIEEARKIILQNKEEINKVSKEVIIENGYNYNVDSILARENFPDKYYGDMLFPQGEYEAFRILIGDAMGQNWWCVMFPPLCFVDETVDVINSSKTKENIEVVIDEEDQDKDGTEINKKNEVKFKFKLFEMFKKDKEEAENIK